MIVVPWTSGQREFTVILPFSLSHHSQLHYELWDNKKWPQKFSVKGLVCFFFPAGKHQQTPSFSTKNSAQIKIDLNFDTQKKQGNRLAGSFLSSWQGITINSLLPLAPEEICFPDYWKETHRGGWCNQNILWCSSTSELQKSLHWGLNCVNTTFFSNYPFETSDGVVWKEINLGPRVYLASCLWFFSEIFPCVVCSSRTGGGLQVLAARHDGKLFHFHFTARHFNFFLFHFNFPSRLFPRK